MQTEDLAKLRARSRWLSWAITALLGCLFLIVLITLSASLRSLETPQRPANLMVRFIRWLVFWGPSGFYIWALWSIRRSMGDVASGRLFQPALVRSLRDVGIGLGAGAFASIIVQPNLMRLMTEAGWGNQIYAGYLHFDVAYAAVAAVGVALVLLSRVLQQAVVIKAELDDIF